MRNNTRIGDVFEVIFNDKKKYFQYIISDMTQLNSDVIRVFSHEYNVSESVSINEIVKDEVQFYAHCVTKAGLVQKLWTRVGNVQEVGNIENITFRISSDYGNPEIKVSEGWLVWKINEDLVRVGKLEGKNREAEIGIIVIPEDIVDRIKYNEYKFFYPAY